MVLRSVVRLGAAALLALLVAGGQSPAEAQGFKWWQEADYQRELALTPEQVTRLEELFQAAVPQMRTQKAALDRLQAELSAMVSDGRADDATADDLITRVEAARADLARSRALMLYRMRRLLTTDQHVKLTALFDAHERSKRGRHKPSPLD